MALMYHCKRINNYVLHPRKSAVGS